MITFNNKMEPISMKYTFITISYMGVEVVKRDRDIEKIKDMDIEKSKSSVILAKTSKGLIPMREELDHLGSIKRASDYCEILRAYIKLMDTCNNSNCRDLKIL